MKQNIADQFNHAEQFSPVLEKLKQHGDGFKVPEGYFENLSPRIVDSISKQGKPSFLKTIVQSFSKPMVWAPSLATVIVAVILIFVFPVKKNTPIPVADEWTQINMAYDASYAEEVLLAESSTIDKYIENKDISNNASITFTLADEPTAEEIKAYLNDHEIEPEIMNEYK